MKLQLQELRKIKGYKSRSDFAEALGVSERQIKSWENGERNLYLHQACMLADFLHCTLDELAGRKPPYNQVTPREQMLVSDFRSLSVENKAIVENTARALNPERMAREKTSCVIQGVRVG